MYVTGLCVCVCILCIIARLRTSSCTVYCNGHRQFMALAVCIFCRIAGMRISFCFVCCHDLVFFFAYLPGMQMAFCYCNGHGHFVALAVCIFCRIAGMRTSFCWPRLCVLFLHNCLVCKPVAASPDGLVLL